jgi:hypothetical protein
MAQVIDFWSRREIVAPPSSEQKMCCARCGADVWTILACGQICCADCEEASPCQINFNCEKKQ